MAKFKLLTKFYRLSFFDVILFVKKENFPCIWIQLALVLVLGFSRVFFLLHFLISHLIIQSFRRAKMHVALNIYKTLNRFCAIVNFITISAVFSTLVGLMATKCLSFDHKFQKFSIYVTYFFIVFFCINANETFFLLL